MIYVADVAVWKLFSSLRKVGVGKMKYNLDDNMVQIWKEEDGDLILLINHTWREKEEIKKYGFRLYFYPVIQEKLDLLFELKDADDEEYELLIERIGRKVFERLVKYKYLTIAPTYDDNKYVWHSQAGEYLPFYLKTMYGIDCPSNPSRVLLLPTLRCNGDCIFCITNSVIDGDKEELKYSDWEKITQRVCDELHPCSVDIVGGEPLLRLDIALAMTKILVENNILVKIITNGMVLSNYDSASKIAKLLVGKKHNIQISLDGDKDTHNFLRPNVDFDHVMKAIKNISSLGLTFGINLTVNKHNYEKVEEVVEMLAKYDPAYIMFGPLQISKKNVELCREIMISEEQENALRLLVKKLSEKHKTINMKYDKEEPIYNTDATPVGAKKAYHRCTGFIEEMTIMPNGRITSCLRATAYKEFQGESITDYQGNLKCLWRDSIIAQKYRGIPVRGKCKDCEYNQQCNMGCPLETYVIDGVFGGYDPHCKFIMDRRE